MDKQAWRVLRKLYPESTQLQCVQTECLQCAMESETQKKTQRDKKERDKQMRKKPLSCPLVRAVYTRSKGIPGNSVSSSGSLLPGVYHTVPRKWCHDWRKYIRTGGDPPHCPDASNLLCDAHKLPLVPPHLKAFLHGQTSTLLASTSTIQQDFRRKDQIPHETMVAAEEMVAAGILRREDIDSQRRSMRGFSQRHAQIETQPNDPRQTSNLLDKENRVVVKILTDDEFCVLEKFWPDSSFAMRFAVTVDDGHTNISWSTSPCRECDAGHPNAGYVVKNRASHLTKNRTRNKSSK